MNETDLSRKNAELRANVKRLRHYHKLISLQEAPGYKGCAQLAKEALAETPAAKDSKS